MNEARMIAVRRGLVQDGYTTPAIHRRDSGHLTIEWGTPDNVPPPWPVLVNPELLVEMIDAFNRTLPREVAA